jgi:hypothetical protein
MTDVDQTAVWDGTTWTVLAPIAGGRNVIINGAMQVAQRGTTATGIAGGGAYVLADRWRFGGTLTTARFTATIEADYPSGYGFARSLKMLVTTAESSLNTGTNFPVDQLFEGQNLQQFAKGTALAKPFTLSFWVKSNVTGTYIARLLDSDNSRSCAASYTVNASATWEKKTITFPADTTGLLDNDNANSLRIQFYLCAGSTFTSGTLNTSWATSVNANIAVGQVNVAAATSNYWQITGVQLEPGSVATPFEFEDYGTTLAKCQRYYWSGTWVGGAIYDDDYLVNYFGGQFPVTMRATPTLSITSGGLNGHHGAAPTGSAVTADSANFTWTGANARTGGASCTVTFAAAIEL